MTKDKRPRFGWCANLDNEPQKVWEDDKDLQGELTFVAVVPLPFNCARRRKAVREFAKGLWTEEGK